MHSRFPHIRHPFFGAAVARTPSEVEAGAGIVGDVPDGLPKEQFRLAPR